jgi:pimeloyl-ACP methyl ester carboxylesterase
VAERTTAVYSVGDLQFAVISTTAPRRLGAIPFVLIHGIGTSHRYLARLHEVLSVHDDVYSFDLPGFGGLPKPRTTLDVTRMAAGIAEIMGRLGLRAVVVIGHSMGVQWVTELALTRPDVVSGLVLMGPVTDDRHRSLGYQAVALARDVIGEPPSTNAVVLRDYLRCGPRWFLKQARFMLSYPLEDRVGSLAMPVLILRGGNDPIAGTSWSRRLRARAPEGSSVATVPGHRHVVQFTAARAVASAVRDFLDRRP